MAYARIAAVTGANKGIGLAIVRQLALRYPSSQLNSGPLLIYLLSRDAGRGQSALESILNDAQLKQAKALKQDGGPTEVRLGELDVSDSASVQAFASLVRSEHPEGIDCLINNAGTALTGFNSDVVKQTLRCNYYGTLDMTETFLPLMRPGGRIVNVSSTAGLLDKYGAEVKRRFLAATEVAHITGLMDDFAARVADGTHEAHGWPTGAAYSVSKAALTGATAIISKRESEKANPVSVVACCPGWVNTDMTKGRGTKTQDEGARTPVMLALDPVDDTPGLFWRDEKVMSWDPSASAKV